MDPSKSITTHIRKNGQLMTMCVQEERRPMMEQRESSQSAHLVVQGKNKNQAKQKGKCKIPTQVDIEKESKCLFYKKNGHMKKDWVKYKKWLEKKGNPISLVCYESNWLMFFITHGGLILVVQSILRMCCRVCKT